MIRRVGYRKLAAVLPFSLALPLMSVLIPLPATALFGYQASGIFTGIFLAMPSVAAIVAKPLANPVRDRKNFEEA